MFTSYGNFFLNRRTSIKGHKLVSEVVEQLGVNQGGSGGSSESEDDGSKSKTKQNGLVRVRTRDIHDNWPTEALPVVQMKGGFGSGNNQGTTDQMKQIPPVGSKVYTEYENDTQYHGVYHGGSASEDKKIPEFTGENYGKTYGHADVGGNLHRTGTEEGKEFIERTHVTGSGDKFDEKGNYMNSAAKEHNFSGEMYKGTYEKGHNLDVKGTAEWKFEDLIINARSIKFQHGGATTNMPISLGGSGPKTPGSRTAPTKRNRPVYRQPGMSV
jgi:hypothetical protein